MMSEPETAPISLTGEYLINIVCSDNDGSHSESLGGVLRRADDVVRGKVVRYGNRIKLEGRWERGSDTMELVGVENDSRNGQTKYHVTNVPRGGTSGYGILTWEFLYAGKKRKEGKGLLSFAYRSK